MTCVKMSAAGSSSSRDGLTRSHRCSRACRARFGTARRAGATLRHAHRAGPDARLALDTMTDVKSVDVGGALFVDKCVCDRAPLQFLIRRSMGLLRQPDGMAASDALASRRGLNLSTSPILQVLRCENQGHVLLKPPCSPARCVLADPRTTPTALAGRRKVRPSSRLRRLSSSASRTRADPHVRHAPTPLKIRSASTRRARRSAAARGRLHRLRSGPQVQHRGHGAPLAHAGAHHGQIPA